MGLTGVLVDRARLVERVPAGRKVEGSTIYSQVSGEWFKARLTLEQATEVTGTAGGRQVSSTPLLLLGIKDVAGDPILITNEDRVEVDSKELGRDLWDITADPEPLRKKRRLIGWQAPLRRVMVHEADR